MYIKAYVFGAAKVCSPTFEDDWGQYLMGGGCDRE